MTILYRGKHVFRKLKAGSTVQITSGNVQVDSGDVAAGGGLRVVTKMSGGDGLNLASGHLTVRSGNVTIGGTLTMGGLVGGIALSGKLSGADGATFASGHLTVSSGNATIGGTATVNGVATVGHLNTAGRISGGGITQLGATVTIASGNLAVNSGTVLAGGVATLGGVNTAGAISGAGATVLGGTLQVGATATLTSGNLSVNSGTISAGGLATFTGGLVTPTFISGGAGVDLASGPLFVRSGNTTIGGTLTVTGLAGLGAATATSMISGGASLNLASGNLFVRSGDITIGGHSDSKVFVANNFMCPAPGTDWTPSSGGILLGLAKATKYAWMPLDFLKVGDEIVGYKLVGVFDNVSDLSGTLDASLVKVALGGAGAARSVPTGGSISQGVPGQGWISNTATLNAVEVVGANNAYQIEILGTTSVSAQLTVCQAEVTVNRKV